MEIFELRYYHVRATECGLRESSRDMIFSAETMADALEAAVAFLSNRQQVFPELPDFTPSCIKLYGLDIQPISEDGMLNTRTYLAAEWKFDHGCTLKEFVEGRRVAQEMSTK